MKIGIICPVHHLENFAVKSDFHMVLPHLFRGYPDYVEFYRNRSRIGEFTLLDNSVFELEYALDSNVIIDAAQEVEISEMVAPEILRNTDKTKKVLEKFLTLRDHKGSNIEVQAVVQGVSFEELVDHVFWLNKIDEVSTIGLPFDLEDIVGENGFIPFGDIQSLTLRRVLKRWTLVDYIWAEAENRGEKVKPIHLMGLADAVELQKYKELVGSEWISIRSNDSSSAFVHGAAGILYNDRGLPCEKIATKLDFGSKLTTLTQYNSVFYNIEKIKQFARYV